MANLNHQPFEEWLLSETTLSPAEARTLQEHLQACESCSTLSLALREVERELRSAATLAPAAGFTSRWQANLAAGRARQHRRQTLAILLASIFGAGSLLLLLGWFIFPVLRFPLPVLVASAYQLTSIFTLGSAVVGALATILRTIFGVVPPTIWVAITVALGGLCVVWIVAFKQLTTQRRALS